MKASPLRETDKVVLRAGRVADTSAIFSLIRGLAIHEGHLDSFRLTRRRLAQILADKQRRVFCLLAIAGKRPVGLVLWFHTFTSLRGGWIVFVEDLFVIPEYRRRGIGKLLLREVARHALKERCLAMVWLTGVSNKKAIAFYKSMSPVQHRDSYHFVLKGEALVRLAKGAA